LLSALKKILGNELFEVAVRKKSLRAGRGKLRGRRFKRNAGMLLVLGEKEKLKTGLFDVQKAKELGIKDLAQGGLGRLTIYTEDAIKELNDRINELFNHILRNRDFSFNYNDLINEVHTSHIKDLYNMIDNGFLFHVRLEEELAKTKFNVIKLRIPQELLLTSEKIKEGVLEIKQGVDKAYQINMNSINFALLLYSYIRVLHK